MFEKNVGRCRVEASDGWPVTVTVSNGRTTPVKFEGLEELRDLHYALTAALAYCEREYKRGGDAH